MKGRLAPVEFYTRDMDLLRGVRIDRLTSAMNGPSFAPLVLMTLAKNAVDWDLATSDEPLRLGPRRYEPTHAEALERWKKEPRKRSRKSRKKAMDLTVDGISDEPVRRPDEFYERVAELYNAILMEGKHKPAAMIAAANDVEANRVSGWIREARRRGFLPPAKAQGKAG
jgi:hypothetical protein